MKNPFPFFLWLLCLLTCVLNASGQSPDEEEKAQLEAVEEARKNDEPFEIYRSSLKLGIYYQRLGRFEEAEQMMLAAVPATERLEKKIYLADLYTNIGLNHYYQGEYEKATSYHLKNLEISEAVDYTLGKIKGTNNLGIIAMRTGDMEEALKQHLESLRISQEANHSGGIAYNLGNLALIYTEQQNFPLALEMRRRSLQLFRKDSNELEITRCLNNLGVSFQAMGQLDSSAYYYEKALSAYRALDDQHGICESLPNVASGLRRKGEYRAAEKLLEEAIQLSEKTNSKEAKQFIYQELSLLYQDWGKYKEALESRLLFEAWKDSVIGQNHLQAIKELQLKYDTERKEKDLLLLSQENQQQSQTIAERNQWVGFLLLFSILALTLGLIIWRNSQQKIRFAREKAAFESMIKTEELERNRIAKDLHDSIGSMIGIIKTRLSAFSEGETAISPLLPLLGEIGEEVRRISHELSPQILHEYGLQVAIQNLVDNFTASENLKIQFYPFGLDKPISSIVEVLVYRMVQELLQNSLKHAQASQIEIHLTRHPDSLNILFEDNGIGLTKADFNFSKGMGLSNIKDRVNQLNGSFRIDDQIETGTAILIEFPLV